MRTKMLVMGCFAIMLSLSGALSVSAYQYGFDNITNNNAVNAATGEAQLFMNVEQNGSIVAFTFTNVGPNASSITDIYFDDDIPFMLQLAQSNFFVYSGNVEFTVGANPPDLSGGQSFSFTSDYSYDSDTPTQQKGVNPGEALTINFELVNGYTFDQVIAALNSPTADGLRVGLHVQGFTGGGSESFINRPPVTPPSQVPEPATLLLLGAGLLGLLGFGRKLRK